MTYTSRDIPLVPSEHLSNKQAEVPEKMTSSTDVPATQKEVPGPWGDHLSNERAIGGSPVPVEIQRMKTIS